MAREGVRLAFSRRGILLDKRPRLSENKVVWLRCHKSGQAGTLILRGVDPLAEYDGGNQ